MNEIQNSTMVLISELKMTLEGTNPDSLDKAVSTTMDAAQVHWLVTDPEEQFRGVVGALLSHYDEGSMEYRRVEQELKAIHKFSAFLNARSAGLNVSLADTLTFDDSDGEKLEAIGLLPKWRERMKVKDERDN